MTPAPAVSTLEGRRPATPWAGVVALFWRADCGPCLSELADLAALRKAAQPLRVQPVVLEETPGNVGAASQALARAGLRGADTLRALGDPAQVLTTYGGAPPRLPLAVAFDGGGRICGRRTGFLGYDQLREWASACRGSDAARH